MKWWRKNWFPVMIFVAVGAGLAFPPVGSPAGPWKPDILVKFAVFVIFFFQGMVLPLRELAGGILHWKFHSLVLVFNFLLAPALAWILFAAPWSPVAASAVPGFLYLSILPTTISSAVALTVASGGNSSAALFGVTLSNLVGIIMVPFGIVFWMSAGGQDVNLSLADAFWRVATLIAFPMALGQITRIVLPVVGKWAKPRVGPISQMLIVFIVWILFAQSASGGDWSQFGTVRLLWTCFGVALYFSAFSGLFLLVWRRAGISRKDATAAYYCATQKGLATGAPMATAFFLSASEAGEMPPLGLILLPLMLYHPLQLAVGSLIASKARAKMA